MSISYTDVKSNELISDSILKLIPRTCNICGRELQFSDSLKMVQCTNKNCKGKILKRCLLFNRTLGIEISTQDLIQIIGKLNIITPYQLLMIDEVMDSGIYDFCDIQNIDKAIQIIKKLKQEEHFIYNIVEWCGIEELSKIAQKILYGFNSIEEVYEEIDSSRVIFLNERLGIRSSDSTIISVEIYNLILAIKEELIFAETQLKIRKHKNVVRLAFSDSNIGHFINKAELIQYLEYTYDISVLHISSINSYTDILIKNGSSSNTKLRIARTINEKYIADSINNGEFNLDDIGKFEDNKLKPIGSIIYIDKLDNILDRLDILAGKK